MSMNFQGSTFEKNTHAQRVQMQRILLKNEELGGKIYASDVIMHKGHLQSSRHRKIRINKYLEEVLGSFSLHGMQFFWRVFHSHEKTMGEGSDK